MTASDVKNTGYAIAVGLLCGANYGPIGVIYAVLIVLVVGLVGESVGVDTKPQQW